MVMGVFPDEIKGLVDDAGVANMSEKDYDILFASIDLDGNGISILQSFLHFLQRFLQAVLETLMMIIFILTNKMMQYNKFIAFFCRQVISTFFSFDGEKIIRNNLFECNIINQHGT